MFNKGKVGELTLERPPGVFLYPNPPKGVYPHFFQPWDIFSLQSDSFSEYLLNINIIFNKFTY